MRPRGDVHMAHGVSDHRHQQLAAVLAPHLEHLAGGQLQQAADRAEQPLAVAHAQPSSSCAHHSPSPSAGACAAPPSAAARAAPPRRCGPRRRPDARSGAARRRQGAGSGARCRRPSPRRPPRAAADGRRSRRSCRRGRARDPRGPPPARGGRVRARLAGSESASSPDSILWPPFPAQRPRRSVDDVDDHTALVLAAAALTTVRSAWAVRPPRPITLP